MRKIAPKGIFPKELLHCAEHFDHTMTIQYKRDKNQLLNILCDKYGSNKGESKTSGHPYPGWSHTYTDFYDTMFSMGRFNVKRIIECGIGTNNPDLPSTMGVNYTPGASLRVWRDYFVNAQVIGLDIDKNILFEEERIKTYHCDQRSKASIERFVTNAALIEKSVDIIIDDGLHNFSAAVPLFEALNPYLADHGVYVIEDVQREYYSAYTNYFAALKAAFNVKFVNLHKPDLPKLSSNRLLVINRVAQTI